MWTTGDIQKIYSVSPQTIRNWTAKFAEFLSIGANPPAKGTRRKFTEDDLKVFSLIVEMTAMGDTYEDVEKALKKGDRGDLPEVSEEELEPSSLLSPKELARTMVLLKERDEAVGQLKQLTIQAEQNHQIIQQKDEQISKLNREIGTLENELKRLQEKKDTDEE